MKKINLSRVLVENRHKRGLTQDDLAAYMGVSKTAVSKWETGTTYPDITLLPQLAAYFNISIDELMGYEPQLTKEQIRILYRQLSEEFSTLPLEKVLEHCREITRKYFSCFPLLYQIGSLYVNHFSFVEDHTAASNLLNEASDLFARVKAETDNVDLAKQAMNMEALCRLSLGKPAEVLDLLGSPDFSMTSSEPLLATAYNMLGNKREARNILQVGIFQHIVVLINLLSIYMGLCLENEPAFKETCKRSFMIAEAFDLNQLHPGIILPLYFTAAQGYMKLNNDEKALEMLEQYTRIATHCDYPLQLHGDSYFDQLEKWLEDTLTLGNDMPRNGIMTRQSVYNCIASCKTLEPLKNYPHFQGESYTENNGKLAIVNFGIILIMFIVSGIMLLFLPDQISILHMGNTYYPLPSVLAVWLLPIIALLINIGFIKQNRLNKVNTAVFVILLIAMTASYISNL